MLFAIHRGLSRVSQVTIWIGGVALLGAAVLVVVDVVARKFFAVTVGGADEISGYVFSGATSWALSFAVLHRANVRIDVIYQLLSLRITVLFDLLGLLALFAYVGTIAYYGLDSFAETWSNATTSPSALRVPLWIPQFFWLSGQLFCTFTLAFLILFSAAALLRGDLRLVGSIAGIPSVEDALQDEMQGLARTRSGGG